MTLLIHSLAAVGALFLFLFVLLPAAKALIFGVCMTWLDLCNFDYRKFEPRHWLFHLQKALLVRPWVYAYERLFGIEAYTTEATKGRWRYAPLFGLRRLKKGNP